MFIHYGLYSLLGRGEWAMLNERIPPEEYKKLANNFNPKNLNIENWSVLARESGMRYMCLTARHHEGFALWDTGASDFTSAKTACGRDLVKEYVDACRKHNLRVGLYYSVADWNDPGFVAGPKKDPEGWKRFVEIAHTQLVELMSRYGKIDYLFYDGCPPPEAWGCAEINRQIRGLQPEILISDRCQMDEDVKSAEQRTFADPGKLWESCYTLNRSWGYNCGDRNWKSIPEILRLLATCAHNGGNFLLNVGPCADGSIQPEALERLQNVGLWLKKNGEAIYGTAPHPFDYADQKISTSNGNNAYIMLISYHGGNTTVSGIANNVKSAYVLSTGERINFAQKGNRVFLHGLPANAPDPYMTVVSLSLDKKPKGAANPLLTHEGKYD